MCLITNQKTPLITEEDIKVYKVINSNYNPFYFSRGNFTYKLGELNETTIQESDDWTAFDDDDDAWIDKLVDSHSRANHPDLKCFGQGYHSCFNLDYLKKTIEQYWKNDRSVLLVECIIPKGSEYYKNPLDIYISNKLIVVKPV